jgi:hypothetical protein
MRNRAKCKLCKSIIESFHSADYVGCQCGEIAIDGGDYRFKNYAKNWENFIRIDDLGNEIPIKIVDPEKKETEEKKEENILSLSTFFQMIENLNQLPEHVKDQAVTNRDLYHILKSFADELRN